MKTKVDHLLACIGEECGEVQQTVGKILRFGLHNSYYEDKGTNIEEIKKEFHDLIAVYEMFFNEIGESTEIDKNMILKKKERILHYMDYAREVEQLEKEKGE